MFCENCGMKVDDDSKFCEHCGRPVNTDAEAEPEDEEIHDLDELMRLDMKDMKDDPIDPAEKTMVFVKSASEQEAQPGIGQEPQQREIPVKSGIGPEDEFFIEPRVGAIRKNMPMMDFGEEMAGEGPEENGESKAVSEPAILEPLDRSKEKEYESGESWTLGGRSETENEAAPGSAGQGADETADAAVDLDTDTEDSEEPLDEEYQLLFCMACGKPLPDGAAFCDACGTRTGAVSPAEIRSRKQQKQGLALGLLGDFFARPESTIDRAADEEACLSGVGFFLLKDVILAVLGAAFMKRITNSLGLLGPWLTGDDSFGFAAKVFLCAIIMDALWVGILFGAGCLFRLDCPIKILIGACGTASLLPTGLLIITTLLLAFVPIAAMEAVVITILITLIVMTKAAAAAFLPPQDRLLYLMSASTACYAVILVIAAGLISKAMMG